MSPNKMAVIWRLFCYPAMAEGGIVSLENNGGSPREGRRGLLGGRPNCTCTYVHARNLLEYISKRRLALFSFMQHRFSVVVLDSASSRHRPSAWRCIFRRASVTHIEQGCRDHARARGGGVAGARPLETFKLRLRHPSNSDGAYFCHSALRRALV